MVVLMLENSCIQPLEFPALEELPTGIEVVDSNDLRPTYLNRNSGQAQTFLSIRTLAIAGLYDLGVDDHVVVSVQLSHEHTVRLIYLRTRQPKSLSSTHIPLQSLESIRARC